MITKRFNGWRNNVGFLFVEILNYSLSKIQQNFNQSSAKIQYKLLQFQANRTYAGSLERK